MKRKLVIVAITAGILAAGALLGLFFIRTGLRIPCALYELTGIQCPGCGNTRATLALLQLDFRSMLSYNLLYPVEILYLLRIYLVCAKNYVKGGRFAYRVKPDWLDITCLSLFLLWTVVRNLVSIP